MLRVDAKIWFTAKHQHLLFHPSFSTSLLLHCLLGFPRHLHRIEFAIGQSLGNYRQHQAMEEQEQQERQRLAKFSRFDLPGLNLPLKLTAPLERIQIFMDHTKHNPYFGPPWTKIIDRVDIFGGFRPPSLFDAHLLTTISPVNVWLHWENWPCSILWMLSPTNLAGQKRYSPVKCRKLTLPRCW